MSRFVKIGEAAKALGVSIQTLRRWEERGYLAPSRKSEGNTRYYDLDQLLGKGKVEADLTVAYARVSSHDQKEDLKRQADVLAGYCTRQGWNFQVIQDLGSGMNYQKKGLKALIQLILDRKITRLVLTHKDRLLRFGAELIFALTVFSVRLYGSRSKKNKKLIEAAKVLIGHDN